MTAAFLSGYEIPIGRKRFEPLAADDRDGFRSVLQLTNPTIGPAGRGINRQRIGLRVRHVLDAQHRTLRDELLMSSLRSESVKARMAAFHAQ